MAKATVVLSVIITVDEERAAQVEREVYTLLASHGELDYALKFPESLSIQVRQEGEPLVMG